MSNDRYLQPGTILDQYTISQHLASGGFGNTYLATNRLGAPVVIKEFYMSGVCSRDVDSRNITISIDENKPLFSSQKNKFLKEAKRIHSFSHPNIVKVSDLFQTNGTAYYVMDYIDGISLAQMQKPLSEEKVMHYLRQIMNALEYVHSKKLTHLDIKPSNIMIDHNDNAILIDFGASKLFDNEEDCKKSRTTTGMAYTPGYAPIEQISNEIEAIGPHSDIYALGATLYNLLTNLQPPLPSEVRKKGLPQISNISPTLMNAINNAMKFFDNERIQNVAELRLALNNNTPIIPPYPQEDPIEPTPKPEPIPTIPLPQPTPPTIPDNPTPPKPSIVSKFFKWFFISLGIIFLGFVIYKIIPKIILNPPENTTTIVDNDSLSTSMGVICGNWANDAINSSPKDISKDAIIQQVEYVLDLDTTDLGYTLGISYGYEFLSQIHHFYSNDIYLENNRALTEYNKYFSKNQPSINEIKEANEYIQLTNIRIQNEDYSFINHDSLYRAIGIASGGAHANYYNQFDEEAKNKCSKRAIKQSIKHILEIDTTEYGNLIGLNCGLQIKALISNYSQIGISVNKDIFLENFIKALNEDVSNIVIEEQNKFFSDANVKINQAFNERPIAKEGIENGDKFLRKIKESDSDIKISTSGLNYKIINPGNETKPTDNSFVGIKFTCKHTNGNIFQSSEDVTFYRQLNNSNFTLGVVEGIKLLGIGGKATLYIPGNLGYGPIGNIYFGVKPNELIICEIELVSINGQTNSDTIDSE